MELERCLLKLSQDGDSGTRATDWESLLRVLRKLDGSGKELQPFDQKTVVLLCKCITRDLHHSNEEIVKNTLSCVAFFLNQPALLPYLNGSQLKSILLMVTAIVSSHRNEDIVQLAAWCLAMQQTTNFDVIRDVGPHMIKALCLAQKSENVSEALQCPVLEALAYLFSILPGEAVRTAADWLLPTFQALLSSETLGRHADHLLRTVRKGFLEHDDALSPLLQDFVKSKGPHMLALLKARLDHKMVLMAWFHYVVLMGSKLHRNASLNDLLRIVESSFNSPKHQSRIAAFRAWRALILNFSQQGHLFHPKRVNLVVLPISNCLQFEKAYGVRSACVQTYLYLLLHLSKQKALPTFLEATLFPVIQHTKTDPMLLDWLLTASARMMRSSSDAPSDSVSVELLEASDPNIMLDNISANIPMTSWNSSQARTVLEIVSTVVNASPNDPVSAHLFVIWNCYIAYVQQLLQTLSMESFDLLNQTLSFLLNIQTSSSVRPLCDLMSLRLPSGELSEEDQAQKFPHIKTSLQSLDKLLKVVVGGDGQEHLQRIVHDLKSKYHLQADQVSSPFRKPTISKLSHVPLEEKVAAKMENASSSPVRIRRTPNGAVSDNPFVEITRTSVAKHPEVMTPKQMEKQHRNVPVMYNALDKTLSTLSEDRSLSTLADAVPAQPVGNKPEPRSVASSAKRKRRDDEETISPFLEHLSALKCSINDLTTLRYEELLSAHQDLLFIVGKVHEAQVLSTQNMKSNNI